MAVEQRQYEDFDIVLQYRRTVGSLSTGRIVLLPGEQTADPEITGQCVDQFENFDFCKVLSRLARTIVSNPGSKVIILRTDRPGLLPYALDSETVELFRVDPVAAIHSMTYGLEEASVEKEENNKPLEAAPVRVGYETLADSFGEFLYLRTRRAEVECPGCGLWSGFERVPDGHALFKCEKRCLSTGLDLRFVVGISRLWAAVSVVALMGTDLERFYLPRAWNDGRSWISREELQDKYAAYVAEKEAACSKLKAG